MQQRLISRSILVVVLFVFTCQIVKAQPASRSSQQVTSTPQMSTDNTIPMDPAVRSGVLPNGMKYYLRKNQKPEHRAELRLAVAAGSMQEDADQLGLAHFVEHMAFNGSEHFTKNELVDYLESVGTRFGPDLNAYTSFDETVYMLQVRTDDQEQFSTGLTVLRDWAGGLLFDEVEIDKERGVVVSEWRSRLSAEQRMQQLYFPKLYYNSRYAERLPIGDPEIVEKASYETVRRFYRDWYRPDLMAVCIVGDIDLDAVETEIKMRFTELPNPASPRLKEEYPVPGHPETLVAVLSDKEATFTNVRIIYKHKQHGTQTLTDYRQNLVHQLYNRMLNARLYEINTVADPPFVFASSGYGRSVGDLATYSSYAMVPEGGVRRAFSTLLIENQRALQHGFVAGELERQKLEMMTAAERNVREQDKTESSRYVSSLVYHFLENEPIPSEQQVIDLYKELLPTITLDEINQLARKWITKENRVVIVTGPEKDGVSLPQENELLAIIDSVDRVSTEPYVDNVNDAPLFARELAPIAIVNESTEDALDIHSFTLANGIKVVYKKTDFKNDQVLVAGYSWGGTSLYPDEQYHSAQAIGQVMQESGIADFDAPQLTKKLTGKTANISPFIAERYEGFNGSCSPKDLETLFQLMFLYVTAPRMENEALQAYLKKQTTILENMLSNPDNYFGDVVNKIRYENHPRRGMPHVEDLQKVNMDQMLSIYRDRFSDLSDFTFFFTGAIDPEQIREMAARYLGNLPVTRRTESWKDVGVTSPEGRIDSTFQRGEAPRSNVRIIYHGDFAWDDESRFAFQIMLEYARIKLRESLREDLGGVYGVSLSGSSQKDPRPQFSINVSFNSDPPRTQELIQAANAVIQEIMNGNIAVEDIQKVKELQRQSRVKNLKENRYWHSGMIGNWMDGTPLSQLTQEYLDQMLEKVTPEMIQNASAKYFSGNRIQVVMHPEKFQVPVNKS